MSSYLIPAGTIIEIRGRRTVSAVPFEITGGDALEIAQSMNLPHDTSWESVAKRQAQAIDEAMAILSRVPRP